MLVKSGLLGVGLVCVLGVVGYFALRASHASPAIAAKQAEGPMGLPELTDIDGLARSRDGRIFATVSQYTVSLWDATSGQNLLVLQNGDNESIFAPAFSRDGFWPPSAPPRGTRLRATCSCGIQQPENVWEASTISRTRDVRASIPREL